MSWEGVVGTCDCQHREEVFQVVCTSDDYDSVDEAKGEAREILATHVQEHEHCGSGTIDIQVHYSESVDT